ncbi:MAG: hypothetical protein SGPRY_005141, partial [Prymnesium sp.]
MLMLSLTCGRALLSRGPHGLHLQHSRALCITSSASEAAAGKIYADLKHFVETVSQPVPLLAMHKKLAELTKEAEEALSTSSTHNAAPDIERMLVKDLREWLSDKGVKTRGLRKDALKEQARKIISGEDVVGGSLTIASAEETREANPTCSITSAMRSQSCDDETMRTLQAKIEVVDRTATTGPSSGVFTDGACKNNPGSGG